MGQWESVEEFRKVAGCHLFTCMLFTVFSGVGCHNSRNTAWGSTAPYWVFGIIGGLQHLILAVMALYTYSKRGKGTEMNLAIGRFRCVIYIAALGFLGFTIGTGITGACADLETCAYQENQGVNKGMAICILVLNILSFLHALSLGGKVDEFQKSGLGVAPLPTTRKENIERPYEPTATPPTNPEPSGYSNPLPATYTIPPPPSTEMPAPPSYEMIVSGSHPTSGLEALSPPPVYFP